MNSKILLFRSQIIHHFNVLLFGVWRNEKIRGLRMGKPKILKQVHVYDVYTQTFSEPTDILIEEGNIAEVGKISLEKKPTAEVIDCSGKYAVPGMFESHTHLATLAILQPESKAWILQSFLDKGITQIRDVGGPIDNLRNLKHEITSGKLQGPDIFYSGPMLEKSPLLWEKYNKSLPGFTVQLIH